MVNKIGKKIRIVAVNDGSAQSSGNQQGGKPGNRQNFNQKSFGQQRLEIKNRLQQLRKLIEIILPDPHFYDRKHIPSRNYSKNRCADIGIRFMFMNKRSKAGISDQMSGQIAGLPGSQQA